MVMHRHINLCYQHTASNSRAVGTHTQHEGVQRARCATLRAQDSEHARFHFKTRVWFRPISLTCCLLLSGLFLSACGDSDSPEVNTDGTTQGQSSAGQQVGGTVAGSSSNGLTDDQPGDTATSGSGDSAGSVTTAGNTSSGQGVIDPDDVRPVAIRLRTMEEVSIDGSFELFGEASGFEFPPQQFSIITQPRHGTVIHASNSRQFTYAPEQDFFGEDDFVYTIGPGLAARVTIEVINVNDPPVLFDEVQRVIEQGRAYTELLIAIDPDNEPLLYEAVNLPEWLTLDASTGLLSGTPAQANVGLFENIGFSVTDGAGLRSEVTGVSIEVIDINDAPTINVDQFPNRLDALESVSVNLYPDDPDGDLVKVSVEQNDFLDITLTGSTVEVIATNVVEVTEVNLVVEATDLRGRTSREIIPLTLFPKSQSGRGRTVHGRSSGEGIHLVVLGDGYREDQLMQFRQDVEELIEIMQSDIGMLTHFSAWNVHMVETPSADSGIDDNTDMDIRDTVYGTGYFCKNVRRLICGDQPKMYEVAIDEYPNFDQIVVLVNDPRYGGSGGNVAISSSASLEIALHEMGHSIADLADEYVDNYIPGSSIPPFFEGRYANVSANSDPEVVPWAHWLSSVDTQNSLSPIAAVGVFEGAYYRSEGFYRPTFDSLMRTYDGVLGPVNSEQWALSVYSMANPVLDISPVNRLLEIDAGELAEFSVVPLFESTVQSVEWRLDSQLIPHSDGNRPKVSLSLPPGRYVMALKVSDISGLIRKPEPHAGVFEWNWTILVR